MLIDSITIIAPLASGQMANDLASFCLSHMTCQEKMNLLCLSTRPSTTLQGRIQDIISDALYI